MAVWIFFLYSPNCPKWPNIKKSCWEWYMCRLICDVGLFTWTWTYVISFKGHAQSKQLFIQASIASQKRTHEFNFTTMTPQVDLFSFVFGKKLKKTKRHFKINWHCVTKKCMPSIAICYSSLKGSFNNYLDQNLPDFLLSRFYLDFISILSKFYPDFILIF